MADKTPDGQVVVSEKTCEQASGLGEKLACNRVMAESGLTPDQIDVQKTHKDNAISRIACEGLGWCNTRVAQKGQGQEK